MNRLPLALSILILLAPLSPQGAAAAPPAVTVTATSYAIGGIFHVEGTLKHADRVARISVSVPGGAGVATINGSAFGANVRGIVYGPGTYNVSLAVTYKDGSSTALSAPVDVVGEHAVFYDRTVRTSVGAYANEEELILPHLYGGRIAIGGLDAGSSVAVQDVNTAAPVPQCLAAGASAPSLECSFAVRPSSTHVQVVWLQAPQDTVTVTISGYRL